MGVIHVLTGPDHLSALATLSGTNISSKVSYSNFLLGIRWGIGHSVGLLVVGSILIAMEESSSEWIGMEASTSQVLESFVGVFMLCLGCYGFAKACRNRREASGLSSSMTRLQQGQPNNTDVEMPSKGTITSFDDDSASKRKGGGMQRENRRTSMEIITQMSMELNRDGDSMRRDKDEDSASFDDVEARIFNAVESLRQNSGGNDSDSECSDVFLQSLKSSAKGALSKSFVNIYSREPGTSMLPRASSLVHKHSHENSIVLDPPKPPSETRGGGGRCSNICVTPGKLAFVAGIVHGVAGPGGVLGVIPAVQLKDAKAATIYLGTFCFTSTMVMGCFSAFYGVISQWLAGGSSSGSSGRSGRNRYSRVFLVEMGSALLSIAVGVIWLVLLAVGNLDQVFHKL